MMAVLNALVFMVGLKLILFLTLPALGLCKTQSKPVNALSVHDKVTAKDKQEIVLLPCPIVTSDELKEDYKVIWLDNDKHLILNGMASSGDLQLTNVTSEDSGIYRCILKDNLGSPFQTSAVELLVTQSGTIADPSEIGSVRRALTAGLSCLLFILISSTIYHLRWKPAKDPLHPHHHLHFPSPSHSSTTTNNLQVPPFPPQRSPPPSHPHRIYLLSPPSSPSLYPTAAPTTTTSATIEMTCISGQKLYSLPQDGASAPFFHLHHPLPTSSSSSPQKLPLPMSKYSSPPPYLASPESSSPSLHLPPSPL